MDAETRGPRGGNEFVEAAQDIALGSFGAWEDAGQLA